MEAIEACITFLAGKAAQTVARVARERLAEHGITPVQYAVLQVLWERDGQSGAEIGARLVIDSATITGMVDRLERLGLVERRPDPGDRRVNRLHLTRLGQERRAPLEAAMDAMNEEVARHFGPDAAALRDLLRRLAAFDPGRAAG